MNRLFGPAVQFHSVSAPINELADKLTLHVSEWLPNGRQPAAIWDDSIKCHVIFWPMGTQEFLSWGCMLMEELHDVCMGTTAEDGNEFLCCYNGEDSLKPLPAKAMYPELFISDDGGNTWLDKSKLQLKR